ncbi:fatty acid-binding protein liver [Biomphalaria pfeifferi]|nr:fatty acid-binding protein liver [Biomphalaria pfeifferi]
MGFSEEKIALYRELVYSFTISKDGDTYKIEIDFKGKAPNAVYELQLGQEVDYKSIDGYTAKLTLTVEDGKSVESYYYGDKDLKWTVTRSVEGNVMTAVTKLADTELTQKLNKA